MALEVEQKQADLVQQFVLLAGSARGRAAAELITHATSHPQLFAFSELLASQHIAEVQLLSSLVSCICCCFRPINICRGGCVLRILGLSFGLGVRGEVKGNNSGSDRDVPLYVNCRCTVSVEYTDRNLSLGFDE